MKDFSPIACVVSDLTEDERKRRFELVNLIRQKKASVNELKNGYSFEFSDASVWTLAAEFVTMESKCCPFLKFALVWESENAGIRIEITGRDGVKEFIKAEMNSNT